MGKGCMHEESQILWYERINKSHCHHFARSHGYWAEPDMGSDIYLSLEKIRGHKEQGCLSWKVNQPLSRLSPGRPGIFLCCNLFLSHASDVIMGKGCFRRWCVPWLIRRVRFLTRNIDPWSHLVGDKANLLCQVEPNGFTKMSACAIQEWGPCNLIWGPCIISDAGYLMQICKDLK